MRAPSKKSKDKVNENKSNNTKETTTKDTITRVSPFRVSTLTSISPISLTQDFGVMARHEGDPVPYEHQFYRATLQGLISFDLHSAGTFSYKNKTGYLNLDEVRIKEAKDKKLKEIPEEKVYRLPQENRIKRIKALLEALCQLEGGAKQALHYTDVTPDLLILTITKGGNNIFGHIINAGIKGLPKINVSAFEEILKVFKEDILSKIYIGWSRGYLDEERSNFEKVLKEERFKEWKDKIIIKYPKEVVVELVTEFDNNSDWLK